jgi:hypothetical protein
VDSLYISDNSAAKSEGEDVAPLSRFRYPYRISIGIGGNNQTIV